LIEKKEIVCILAYGRLIQGGYFVISNRAFASASFSIINFLCKKLYLIRTINMKKFALLLVFIFAFALSGLAQKNKPLVVKADPKKEVQAVFDRLVEGIKQADAAKVMSTYEKSDRILFFNNNGTATMGWDTMKANREASYKKVSNVSLDTTGVRIEMLGKDAAYLTCKWKQSQEFNGKLENASGRMTLVFRIVGKDWKIVHLHTSPDNPDATRPLFPSERDSQ
jgi:ketosteroid isomerase-like protein